MAMSRKYLADLGLTREQVEGVIGAYRETLDALKTQRDRDQARLSELEGLQTELNQARQAQEETQSQLAERQTALDTTQTELDKVRAAFEDYRAKVLARQEREAKMAAYREVLKSAGITSEAGLKKVLKYTDLEQLSLAEDGSLEDQQELIRAAREEWPELLVTAVTAGAPTAHPPACFGGSRYLDRSQILAIPDTAQRQQAIAENHALFGF